MSITIFQLGVEAAKSGKKMKDGRKEYTGYKFNEWRTGFESVGRTRFLKQLQK